MYLRTALYTCVLLFTLGLAAQAGSVPELISHQGRLLKADGTPESGAHSLTFNVYEASSGGVALWTESHPGVVVDEGLFTVLLGSTVPVTSDLLSPPSSGSPVERWLEVTVDGQVLSPRMRLAAVPYSASSSRVDGDVETSPGELRLHGMSGSTTGTIRMTASDGGNEDSTQLYLYARKDGQVTSADFNYKASSLRSSLTLGTDADGDAHHENQLTATATFTDGSTMDITSDSDDDGIADSEVLMKSKGSTGGIRLGGMSGSTTGTIRMAASPDSTYEDHSTLDAQGYSGTRRGMNSNVRSTALLGVDRGLRQTSIEQTCDSTSARGVLGGMSGSTTGTIRMMAGADSTRNYLDMDDDGDGYAESDVRLRLTPIDAEVGISTDRFAAGPRQSVSMDGSFSHARTTHFSDFDHDGIQDVVILSMTDSAGATNSMDVDSDDDGVSDLSVSSEVNNDSATFRLNGLPPGEPVLGTLSMSAGSHGSRGVLSGMSGSTTGTIRMAATGGGGGGGGLSSISEIVLEADTDGDGLPEVTLVDKAEPVLISSTMGSDSNHDGSPDRVVSTQCDTGRASLEVANIGSSGQDGVSIEVSPSSRRVTMGNIGSSGQDGIDMEVLSSMRRLTVGNIGSSGQDGVSIEVDGTSRRLTVGNIGSSGQDGVAMEVDASTSRLVVHNIGSSGQDGVSFEATSTGAHMGLDTIPGAAKIAVGGGAYCDGTNWVNASDVNSKENFESVNGAEVLDRLADLKITRWNYKSQPGVEHIGPTAQDFQKAFGVGSDNKSISTIDPSGIALAAIKELQKQNADLRGENAELREALEALSRKVDALVATQ